MTTIVNIVSTLSSDDNTISDIYSKKSRCGQHSYFVSISQITNHMFIKVTWQEYGFLDRVETF